MGDFNNFFVIFEENIDFVGWFYSWEDSFYKYRIYQRCAIIGGQLQKKINSPCISER